MVNFSPTARFVNYLKWLQEGERLFGANAKKWRFVCPACGKVQSAEDFEKHAAVGGNAEMAWQTCLYHFEGGACHHTNVSNPTLAKTVVVGYTIEPTAVFEFYKGE